ncbi:MAG: type II toxin-antitoxin system VapC family toxin [Deltaproteobacteria bacterium]|nr:type II toxin-antitoxin system VapC family toxin [Deltaproteobacteria bacterium]
MNSIIVDTNVFVYIYSGIPYFGRRYAELLGNLSAKYNLVIPKLVYGELSLIFSTSKQLNSFLNDTGIIIGDIDPESYILAAKRWDKYNKRRVLICQRCGKKLEKLICRECDDEIKIRQHILTDFIIGAYALQTEEQKIVTSDKGYYSNYFPELTIITADS